MQGENSWIHILISFTTNNLITVMLVAFTLAIFFRLLIYVTVKRQAWFVREFEKRVYRALPALSNHTDLSFFHVTKNSLQKTYHEIFELRRMYGRRHPDQIMTVNDRIFLVQEGVARIVMDFLRHARYLEKHHDHPKFLEISKSVFENNPIFGRLFGLFSVSLINNVLNILPSLFVIGGIFGTFLGIMDGLPALGGMDVTDSNASKQVMDEFLMNIAFAMNTSIMGILLSVLMTIINTTTAPENLYYSIINRFTTAIELLWNKADHNVISASDAQFIEARSHGHGSWRGFEICRTIRKRPSAT
ncbi:MAG: hypothetical protein ACOH5I_14000 [Oligoflexus sp.]